MYVQSADICASESTAASSTVTTTTIAPSKRFLGRMSWDCHVLDVSQAEIHDAMRSSLSPQRRSLTQLLPPAPSLSPTRSLQQPPVVVASLARSEPTHVKPQRSSLALNGGSGTPNRGSKSTSVTMSCQESMDEVEKLLDENVRNRYYDRQLKSPHQIAALKQAKAKSAPRPAALPKPSDPNQRLSFEFAPLQDQLVLAAAAAQDAQDEDEDKEAEQECDTNHNNSDDSEISNFVGQSSQSSRGDNENELFDPDTATSTQVRLKYFGAAAKTAYYKTYQELHGKSHLFVEKAHKTTLDSRRTEYAASQTSLRTHTASGGLKTAPSPLRKSTTMLSSIVGNHGSLSDPQTTQSIEDLSRIPTSSFARRRQALQSPAGTGLGQPSGLLALANMESSPSLHSPRVVFLSSCIAKSHPAISILIRKDNCHTFDFSHQGLGDRFIIQFAECLPDLPLVEAINVSDNRLSDHALNALLLALENKPNLTKLDISENEIGFKSAKSLRNYIASSLCTIKTLTLNNADVDDQECTLFMIAFEKNKSVEHLYLRSNRVGQVVSIKAKLKGSSSSASAPLLLPTGGESIGAMLNVNLNIATLDLSWNLLKFTSVSPIANALQLNYNLKELNLSYNACGDQGAMVFGQTIRINTALEKLNLSYNSIGAKGAMVIAGGLAANKGLRELVLDGNSIGMESGRALMHASCTRPGGANTICHLSLFECNLTRSVGATQLKGKQSGGSGGGGDSGKVTKEMTLFNPADPTGNYALDLSDPYENMIAHELLRIATFKAEFRFVQLKYALSLSGGNSKSASTKIELSRRPRKKAITSDNRELILKNRSPVAMLFAQIDKDQSGSVDSQELIQALREHGLNISKEWMANLLNEYDYDRNGSLQEDEFQDLFLRCGFAMVDTDHSGSLNAEEIENVLRFVGIQDVTPHKIKRMMAHYDLNSSGEIDEHEFLEFMKAEMFRAAHSEDHQGHISDDHDGQREKNLDEAYEAIALREASGVIWKIPTTGLLSIEFDRDHEHHQEHNSGSKGDNEDESGTRPSNAFSLSQNVSDAVIAKIMASAQGVSRNNVEQADFLRAVLADSDLFFTALQAEQLLDKQGELKSAPRKIAALVRILPQMVNRREAISLVVHLFDPRKQWQERFALRKQLGNMYSVLLGSLTNKYCFDLTSADDRAALKKLALIAQEEKQFSKNRSGRSDTSQHGNWENFRNATIDGKMVLLTSTYILNALLAPGSNNQQLALKATALPSSATREDVKRKVEFFYVSTTRPPRGTKNLTRRRFEQLLEVLSEPIADDSTGVGSSDRRRANDQSVSMPEALEKTRLDALLHWEILRNSVVKAKQGSEAGILGVFRVKGTLDGVQQKLSQLEMLVSDRWLHSDQATELIAAFPNAVNARARAACILFGRLVDADNFVQVRTCVY